MILDWGVEEEGKQEFPEKTFESGWVDWNLTVVQVGGAIDNNHYANSVRNTATVLTQMVSPSSSV